MLLRVVSGLLLAPLLAVLIFAPPLVSALLLAAISVKAVTELLAHRKRPLPVSAVLLACAASPAVFALAYLRAPFIAYFAAAALLLAALFALRLARFATFLTDDLAFVYFAALAVPLMYSSVLRLMLADPRRYAVLLPFVITIFSDMAAHACGSLWGKHPLAPVVSPGKTVEGSVCGFVFCVVAVLLYGYCLARFFPASVSYPRLLLFGAAGNVAAQFGDLCFSAVKREYRVKDFGKLIPGHGGALDRFDSLLFVAPLTELLCAALPAIAPL
ncbi:MAG: phosphatidate cytidylyltransferase [Oscillospiraceae bacterium]|jgi:phosphatidate cytidylyltransferase|nr:phosphatidate cytidylyltransferase [Oscillospiraceae bacterium]